MVAAFFVGVLGSDETITGGTGPWCWISTDADNQLMWMLITGKGWEIACYIITMSLYILLKVHLVRKHFRARQIGLSTVLILHTPHDKQENYNMIYHVIIGGFVDVKIYMVASFMVLAHDEVHVVNSVNEDKTCGIQVCWLHINGLANEKIVIPY